MVYNNNMGTGVGAGVVENFLDGIKGVDVTPGYAAFDEMAFFVVEAAEMDYNDLMMNIGVQELACLESNHCEVVYEAGGGKVKELVGKAVDMFKSMWERLKGMFDRALKTINDKSMEFRRKVMDKMDKSLLQKRVNGIKKDRNFGTTYEFVRDKKDLSAFANETIQKLDAGETKITGLWTDAVSDAKAQDAASISGLDSKINAAVKETVGQVANGAEQIGSVVKIMKDNIRGSKCDVNGSWVSSNWGDIYKEATEFPKTKREIKAAYKKAESSFNDTIKNLKKGEDSKYFEAGAFTKALKGFKDLKHICVACSQATVSCLNERQAFYRTVIMRVIGSKPVREASVVGESATTMDKIDSLFNWD